MSNILIVDDYSVTQRVFSHILRRFGYTIFTAENGLMALDVLAETNIDLILCDLDMPEMDGITLLGELKNTEHYTNIPVIILTASGEESDRVEAERLGADGFLSKPVQSDDLLAAVESMLES